MPFTKAAPFPATLVEIQHLHCTRMSVQCVPGVCDVAFTCVYPQASLPCMPEAFLFFETVLCSALILAGTVQHFSPEVHRLKAWQQWQEFSAPTKESESLTFSEANQVY